MNIVPKNNEKDNCIEYQKGCAEVYVKVGCYLFPLNGKKPASTGNWSDLSTQDLPQIYKWIDNGHNLGVDCGKSRLLVLDLDTYKKEFKDSDLPIDQLKSIRVITGRGGEHIYLRQKDGHNFGCSSKGLNAEGIDVKGIGGYVVAAGSIHPDTGKPYTFVEVSDAN